MNHAKLALSAASRLGQEENFDRPEQRLTMPNRHSTIKVRILRSDPTNSIGANFEDFEVPASPYMRVLDALNYISEEMCSDIAYRWSCGVKKCGTCAVRVNGREVLACWEAAEADMTIEPLRHLPVVRDLVVDRARYDERVLELEPWLKRGEAYPGFPERIGHREMQAVLKPLDCVNCLACFSVCPVLDLEGETKFAGPATLVQLAQVALDPRDRSNRAALIADADIFDCVSCYKCEQVCPVHIPIVSHVIEPLKRILYEKSPAEARHAGVFMNLIKYRGFIEPSTLVLFVQRIHAFRHPIRLFRLILRGKAQPLRMITKPRFPALAQIQRLFDEFRKAPE